MVYVSSAFEETHEAFRVTGVSSERKKTMPRKPVITIDGPAGAGKSTVSKLIAKKFSFFYLDTGALYRALAYQVSAVNGEKPEEVAIRISTSSLIEVANENGMFRISIDSNDVTDLIRTEKVGSLASKISAIPSVRKNLLSIQRKIGAAGGVVAEGRDMGTVVFPDAEIKFYLDASVCERAIRRYKELFARNPQTSLKQVEEDIIARDRQDSERELSPLMIPKDAVVIDSTDKTIDEIVANMSGVISRQLRFE
jgi:cytidylate kinase